MCVRLCVSVTVCEYEGRYCVSVRVGGVCECEGSSVCVCVCECGGTGVCVCVWEWG